MSPLNRYNLENLNCADCALKIEEALKNYNFSDVKVNLVTQSLSIASDDLKTIKGIVSSIEPDIKVIPYKINSMEGKYPTKSPLYQIGLALILLFFGVFATTDPIIPFFHLGNIFLFLAYIISGWKVLYKAFLQLKRADFTNEYFLMSIATLGAIFINEIPEAVAVMVFYTIGEYLQTRAVNHSRHAISSLIDIRPDVAHKENGSEIVNVPISEISLGDTILVKPGERVPLDGEILQGQTTLDMSFLTGESHPIDVEAGMEILSGSIPSGSLHIKVTSHYYDSTVSRILNAVENATEKKSKTELFITRFARYYTPFVLFSALFLAIIPPLIFGGSLNEWIYRALVVLVISCPCALVVSIPLVYFSGIGKSSKDGILLKGANTLDKLTNISTVLFDKTGTLTIGKFKVVTIVPTLSYSPNDILYYAALAESQSNHPIAISIREAYGKAIDSSLIAEYEELPALGISMKTTDDNFIVVGNDKMIHEIDCLHTECIQHETAVYVVLNSKYIGHIIIDDQVKATAQQTIKELKSLNITDIALLTGDTKRIAQRVANQVGIDRVYASLMPLNKLEILEKYIQVQTGNKYVAFVGDGINDAPVIARADIGIAMAFGSDATIEAADLVIMDNNPSKLPQSIKIAKKTSKIAKQNIIFALVLKGVFIFLGAIGLASMWVAVFGDMGVALLTILNSLRLLR
ncbi:MAG: cadmium-translocating P-type ATPase [Candidatus Heimdallarchaeota archaeon]|nr:cadmium-translocating P-type ATPase [Candidatus Heimdallarchaeota archaeon]